MGIVAGSKVHFCPDLPSTMYHHSAIICLWLCLLCWPGQLGPNSRELFMLGAQPGAWFPLGAGSALFELMS